MCNSSSGVHNLWVPGSWPGRGTISLWVCRVVKCGRLWVHRSSARTLDCRSKEVSSTLTGPAKICCLRASMVRSHHPQPFQIGANNIYSQVAASARLVALAVLAFLTEGSNPSIAQPVLLWQSLVECSRCNS